MSEGKLETNLYSISGIFQNLNSQHVPFGGYFLRDTSDSRELLPTFRGKLTDVCGESEIYGGFLDESVIGFTKKYLNGGDCISYSLKFNSEKGLWLGEYEMHFGFSNSVSCDIRPSSAMPEGQLEERRSYANPEEWANNLLDDMVRKGLLKIEEDPETGKEVVLPGRSSF